MLQASGAVYIPKAVSYQIFHLAIFTFFFYTDYYIIFHDLILLHFNSKINKRLFTFLILVNDRLFVNTFL